MAVARFWTAASPELIIRSKVSRSGKRGGWHGRGGNGVWAGAGGGAPPVVRYDPLWSNVTFLYSWEDIIDGWTEDSDSAHTLGNYDCTIDTTRKLFGKNTTRFDNDDWINTTNGNVFELRTGDLVIESWVYISEAIPVGDFMICGIYDTGGQRNWRFEVKRDSQDNNIGFVIYPSGTSTSGAVTVLGPPVPKDEWAHVVIQRDGDDHLCFTNGVPGTLVTTTTRPSGAGSRWMTWGQTNNVQQQFHGNLAESRFTQGEVLYPAGGFTPPPGPFPRS